MRPEALRKQAAALDRAAAKLIRAIETGRETSAAVDEAKRQLRGADRMIAASRRALRR